MNGRSRLRTTSARRRSEQEGAAGFSAASSDADALPEGVITALRRARGAVQIDVDGAPWLAVSHATAVAAGLRPGLHVDAGVARDLRIREAQHQAHEAALRLLAYRPRSEAELRERLGGRGLPPDAIEHAIERLKAARLLDDAAFARGWVESRAPGRGRTLLARELRARGIATEVVEEALAAVDDLAQATRLAHQQAERSGPLPWREFQRRIGGFLARRGFSYGTISAALRDAWQHQHRGESEEADL